MADPTKHLLRVLKEAFEGPREGASTYFLDGSPDSGLRGTLAKVSAEAASRGRTPIAAHAHHLLFSFDAFKAYLAGDRSQRDWNESWRVREVDDSTWRKLQDDLDRAYGEFRKSVEGVVTTDDAAVGVAVAAATHIAYHLGAIRHAVASA